MAYQVAICAVGIYFMEDALHFLKKYTCELHKACSRHFNTKRKSVVVRKIGSYVTWVHAPRFYVAMREEFKDVTESDTNQTSKCNCLSNSCTGESRNSVHLENRIEELEKELLQLQTQVSNILLKNVLNNTKDSNVKDDVVSSSSDAPPSLPPPPPPPPPPLPPTPLIQTRTFLVKVKAKTVEVNKKDSTTTIMEELSKRPPKLRRVARSPGGTPIRNNPAPSDNADILLAVLKKRFKAFHGEKQECCTLSSENSAKTQMITGH